jgi:hypothetical protein
VPDRPQHLSLYAEACLEALAARAPHDTISLGGALGLAHYFEFRQTHDLDAWWVDTATEQQRSEIIDIVEKALRRFGEVRTRRWGDVVSVELRLDGRAVFSFQVARRSALLAEPTASPWPGVRLDSFEDLVASKMVALVERGAPRDFLDIFTLCRHARSTVAQCWRLWGEREAKAGRDPDRDRATLAVRTHLARIEQVRPLSGISDPAEREAAADLRRWYVEEFIGGLPD